LILCQIKLNDSKIEDEILETRIIDLNGKIVFQFKGFQSKINTQKIESGIYLIQMLAPESTFSKKIIIQ